MAASSDSLTLVDSVNCFSDAQYAKYAAGTISTSLDGWSSTSIMLPMRNFDNNQYAHSAVTSAELQPVELVLASRH
ncbi:hypothetical protein FLL45_00475 [Aliikangiella marina]|uniref:Uncharacterized protein n=1 Tax=Aliikangiella marina TaxID=1712262 RepID=A0A545TGV9_9GAMM|nr:hypothetical protein [Aliikangiella marina]TQV76474.1 hypothetical protein FLL45_00475 [Aliikangiella marina]